MHLRIDSAPQLNLPLECVKYVIFQLWDLCVLSLSLSLSRHAGGFEAPGSNCSMLEVAAADPSQYVHLFHPLRVNTAIIATEPPEAKGFINGTVRKKRRPKHTLDDFRAMTLRNHC